ncbi:unnamed protein product [Cutaneotrichosporon oleaginosum]
MATPSGPLPPIVTVEPLRSCQPAAISWTWPGALPPFTVQTGREERLQSLSTLTTGVLWPVVNLAGGWRLTVQVSGVVSNATAVIVSGLQAVLPCPPGEECTCNARPLPGEGSSTTSSSTAPPSSSPPSSSPTSTAPSNTSSPFSMSTSPPQDTPKTSMSSSTSSTSGPSGARPSDSTMTVTHTPSGGLQSQGPAVVNLSDNTGLIVGTTVGGLAFIVILATLLFFSCRWYEKRERHRKLEDEFDLGGQAIYDPGYHRDPNRDMEEVHNLTPYPFGYEYNSHDNRSWNAEHGRSKRSLEPSSPEGSLALSPTSGSLPSASFPLDMTATSGYVPSAQVQPIRSDAPMTDLGPSHTCEDKLEAERPRSRSSRRARPSANAVRPRPSPVQAEDAGFLADGDEVPPVYQPDWEVAQRQRIGYGLSAVLTA